VGDTEKQPFQLSFNSSLRVDFQGARVTSDGGLILVRELDERLGFGELVDRHLSDSRRGKNIQLPLADLLRQSIYGRLAVYEDVNDAAPCPGSDLPAYWLAEDLGAGRGLDLALAVVRDGSADAGGKPCRSGRTQPGVSSKSRSYRFASAHRAGYGQY
jgi:hypothetical protein